MSTPIGAEPYFDMDVVKENIEESGLTSNEAKLQNWGDESDREIDTALFYLFAPASFPLSEALMITEGFTANDFKKIKQLSNERTLSRSARGLFGYCIQRPAVCCETKHSLWVYSEECG